MTNPNPAPAPPNRAVRGDTAQLTVGSLFSGIGGIDLGLERAGMRVVWHSEIDPYASRVLAKHWPTVPNLGDITKIDFTTVEPVDVLAGGFPCQDISLAGKGVGIEGERSGLWREYGRAIRELRPRYVLVENVAALLSRGIDRVLGDLAALGYHAEWDCLPAAAVGAPHRRDRLWLVAYANCSRLAKRVLLPGNAGRAGIAHPGEESGLGGSLPHAGAPGRHWSTQRDLFPKAGKQTPRRHDPHGLGLDERTAWDAEPDVGRVADGVPSRVDRLRGLGNAVVPQIPELIGGWIVAHAKAMEAAA